MVEIENFQVILSVQELAKIAFSKWLLEKPKARGIILNSLTNNDETLLKSIYSEMFRNRLHMILPKNLEESLIRAIESMASRMFRWIKEQKYGERGTPLLESYVDYVCFTNNGFVDTSESLRSMYQKPEFPKLPLNYKTWKILCYNCLEDCITHLWYELRNIISMEMMKCYIVEIKREDILKLYWLYKMETDDRVFLSINRALSQHLNIVHYRQEIDVKMFILSIIDCNYVAVQYFWKLLNNNQKTNVIAQLTYSAHYAPPSNKCRKTKIGEYENINLLIIFLLRILSYYEKENELIMVFKTSNIMKKLLYWPWQDTLLRIIKDSRYHDTINYFSLIKEISEFTCKENANSNYSTRSKIFLETWKKIENSTESFDWINLIAALLVKKDIVLLRFCINNENLREKKPSFLKMILTYFHNIRQPADFVHRFIENVLILEKEKEKFRSELWLRDVRYE